ncbi:MAG TPA: HD domain-containing phosphohydrolase [Clostridia bacterium]|nr:HD domain-containing phosphohydrolase [Clostridia bacterium]
MKNNKFLAWENNIFEFISDPVLCMDTNGHITYMNFHAQEFFSLTCNYNDKISIDDVTHNTFQNEINKFIEKAKKQPVEKCKIDFWINDEKKNVCCSLKRINGPESENWICLIIDKSKSDLAFEEFLMKEMLSISKQFIISNSKKVNYKMIAEEMQKLTKAKYVVFNTLETNGKDFQTKAIAGLSNDIYYASKLLGFDLIDKKWHYDPIKAKRIQEQMTTVFTSLSDLTGNVITGSLIKILEKTFNTGQVAVIRIMKDDLCIGDFTVIMSQNEKLKHIGLLEIFASQVGLYVEKNRTEKTLAIINRRLANIIEATHLGTWEWQIKGNSIFINNRLAEIIGYEKSEIEPLTFDKWVKFVHPTDFKNVKKQLSLVFNEKKEFYDLEIRMKHKDGHWVWIKTHGKVIEWSDTKKPELISGTHEDISKRKELEETLKESEKENRLLIEKMEQGLAVHQIICDENNQPMDYKFLSVNKKFEEQIGIEAKDLIGKRVMEILPKTEKYWIEKYGKVALTGKPMQYENYSREVNRWFKVSAYSPKPLQFAVLVDDITDRKKIENDLFLKKEQFKTTLLSLGEGVISTDAFGTIVMMNKVAANLTGWNPAKAIRKSINEVFIIKNEIDDKIITDLIRKVLVSNKIISLSDHTYLISKSENVLPIEVTASPIKDQNSYITGVVIVFNDISERREREKQIKYLSFHDALTGLYNRRYLVESMKRLDVKRNLPLSIILLDVNGLKLTNDAFGHEAGDQLLIKVSKILKTVCRADDIIGRIGGDEFIIILPKTSKTVVKSIKERILQESNYVEDSDVVISLAIGYATKTSLDTDINDIRIKADNRMYKNKLKYGSVMRNKTIKRIVQKINQEYIHEKEHTQEVANYSVIIAKALGFRDSEVEEIKNAGLLHDIGKISIPFDLLMKSSRLTSREYDIIKRHPETSYQILKSVDEYVRIAKGVLHHHERWDGTGYPEGLEKEEIPLISRILAIADAYQSMTSERSYRSSQSKSEAITELIKFAEKQFDPKLVNIFINEIK